MSNNFPQVFDRDLSWLQFNKRVLDQAKDRVNPLLERLKFLGIASANLDEFFMVRFAYLASTSSPVNNQILEQVSLSLREQSRVLNQLSLKLRRDGVDIVISLSQRPEYIELARDIFIDFVLTELGAPRSFNHLALSEVRNLQLAVIFSDRSMYIVPRTLPLIYWKKIAKNKIVAFFLDDLISIFLSECYGIQSEPLIIRLTRDADIQLELDDNESIPDLIRRQIRAREKRNVLRMQWRKAEDIPDVFALSKFYRLKPQQVFASPTTLVSRGVLQLTSALEEHFKDRPKLFFPKFKACVPRPFDHPGKIFRELEKRDYFFHQPYDSFDGYVNFIREAVAEPEVCSIEQTIYRIDALSEVVDLLSKGARLGKLIKVYIEPRARFDEINNIKLSEVLKKSGVEVIFAKGDLKVHAKIALITMKSGKTYSHLSTGNYNAKTARQYTDMAIFTANTEIGEDLRTFFDSIPSLKNPRSMTHLLTAPGELHRKILSLIKRETKAAKTGYIFVKVNALVDERVVAALYEASRAGVKIDLMVRGACVLVPGVKDQSENIRVFSVVDRFLEHSRIYYFRSSDKIFLSSADLMPRNFFARLEVAFPVLDLRIKEFLVDTVIPIYLNDKVKSRVLKNNGKWVKRSGDSSTRSQLVFTKLAKSYYRSTPLFFNK